MIFDVTANQIERLDQNQLVSLLRKLAEAELLKHDIPLSSGNVPAQINIPDGGDDGRVSWQGGVSATDWLPSRFTIFQSKKGSISKASLKAETQTKSSKKSKAKPESSKAIKAVLHHQGAYVVITATPVVETKKDECITGIKEGITAAGSNPSLVSHIKIYDCNRLATWTNQHPAVALWLNSELRQVHLHGFQSYSDWQKADGMHETSFQDSETPRFIARGKKVESECRDVTVNEIKNFQDISSLITKFYNQQGRSARIVGASGYGKTRFVHELVGSYKPIMGIIGLLHSQLVYCIYEDVKDRLTNVVRDIANSGSPALIIVDDCPNEQHTELMNTVDRPGSHCRLITIGVESNTDAVDKNLVIHLKPAADDLIDAIATSVAREESQRNKQLIRDISQGFPRMAILATKALLSKDMSLQSAEALVDRIVWGKSLPDSDALEVLQIASLFPIVGIEHDAATELKSLADFCNQSYRNVYQHLKRFEKRGILILQGDYGAVQPVPLTVRLSSKWLENNPDGTLKDLYDSLSGRMRMNMLRQLRWLSHVPKISAFATTLAYEALPDYETLNSYQGAMVLDSLVHLAPDNLMQHLELLLKHKSVDDLASFDKGKSYTIYALAKLAFRGQTFARAAQLLLKLSAAEEGNRANSAAERFLSLYHLYLGGTEVSPSEKIDVIDKGLLSTDQRIRKLCVDALGRMLKTNHFSRIGWSSRIGSIVVLEDWQPRTSGEIYDYYRSALTRLEMIAKTDKLHASVALTHIGIHLSSLFSYQALYDDLEQMILRLLQSHPRWYEPIKALNKWLFFRAKDADNIDVTYAPRLRALYNQLLPEDPVELLLLYSSDNNIHFHDPDKRYDPAINDHYYAERQIEEIISNGPTESSHYKFVVEILAKSHHPLALDVSRLIAQHVNAPESLLQYVLVDDFITDNIDALTQLVRGIILGVARTDQQKAMQCLYKTLEIESLRPRIVELITTVPSNDELVNQVTKLIEEGIVALSRTQGSSLGLCLDNVQKTTIQYLFDTLSEKGVEGAWPSISVLHSWLYETDLSDVWKIDIAVATATNPDLLKESRHSYGHNNWYDWYYLFQKIVDSNHMDAGLCARLLDFVTMPIEPADSTVSYYGEDYISKALIDLANDYPEQVWNQYHDSMLAANATHTDINILQRHRLKNLFTTEPSGSVSGSVFDNISAEIYISWMLKDKKNRMKFVLEWIRLFDSSQNELKWSPGFVRFIDVHADKSTSLDVLYTRLTTGTFIGQYSDLLEKRIEQLYHLRDLVTNVSVKQWLDRVLYQLERMLDEQRRSDTNFQAHYFG